MLEFLYVYKLQKQFSLFLFTNFLNPKKQQYSPVWHITNTSETQTSILLMLLFNFFSFLIWLCVVCECVHRYVLNVCVWKHIFGNICIFKIIQISTIILNRFPTIFSKAGSLNKTQSSLICLVNPFDLGIPCLYLLGLVLQVGC